MYFKALKIGYFDNSQHWSGFVNKFDHLWQTLFTKIILPDLQHQLKIQLII